MSDDDTVISINTPTKSEFATFQVLANKEFVDMNKPLPDHTVINVLEEARKEVYTPEPKKLPNIKVDADYDDDYDEDEDSYSEDYTEDEIIPPFLKKETTPIPVKPVPQVPTFELPKSKYQESTQFEIDAEKEALLFELQQMEKDGIFKPTRPLTMKDSLEEIQFQYDRIQSELNSNQIVDMAKSAIKMGSGMVEMTLKSSGIKIVDGFHNNLCKDMNKFNRPLSRLYKKYWRRGGASPEMELAFIVFGSLAYTVVQNKMGGMNIFGSSSNPTQVPKPNEPTPIPTTSSTNQTKPPQMPSLNIPSSFAADTKWKEMEIQQEKQRKEYQEREDKLKREMEEREKKMMSTIDNMNNSFKAREDELYNQLQNFKEKEKQVSSDNVRKVTLQVTATPKGKNSKNKTELNLDEN